MKKILFAALTLLLALSACNAPTPTPTTLPIDTPTPVAAATDTPLPAPTGTPTPEPEIVGNTPLVISQVMAGDHDFVELYNAQPDPINLNGYRLVYQLGTTQKDLPVFTFDGDFWLSGYHHALLVRDGDDVGIRADGTFEQQLNIKTGGIGLYDPAGNLVDAVAWGKAPAALTEGSPLDAMPKDAAFERLPGGDGGNFTDTDDNAADFTVTAPNPRASIGGPLPAPKHPLAVRLIAPDSAEPGQTFDYQLQVENRTGHDLAGLSVTLPLPADLTVQNISDGGTAAGNEIEWTVDALADGESLTRAVTVQAPWTYTTFRVDHYQVAGSDLPHPAFGAAAITDITGGVVPIAVARTLPGGTRVTIEGVATMYTGGFYAGGGNTKFYIQDDTGGIQVQCFGEDGPLPTVKLGDRVRVSGEITVYRDSLEIIPATLPADVEIVETASELSPEKVAIADIPGSDLAGKYVSVTGKSTRIEEFTYSYELDLMDDAGNTLLVYVDKLTNLTTDDLDVGNLYTVAGVLEYYQGKWQLKPRAATDFREVYPPILRVELNAPNTVQPGETLEYALTAFNHTDAPLTHVTLRSPIPAELNEISDGGVQDGDTIKWEIPALSAGDSFTGHFSVIAPADAEQIVNDGYQATAQEFDAPATGPAFRTFIGDSVPIWAIQGDGEKSPYTGADVTTTGIVTAVFDRDQIPGFFIQETVTDDDPATSEGLFVWDETGMAQVSVGDSVRVSGTVKEKSAQTQIQFSAVDVLSPRQNLPAAVLLNPPAAEDAAATYFESLEGMLVSVDNALAVSPVSKYGETNVVLKSAGVDRIYKNDPNHGLLITIDEGSWTENYSDNPADLPWRIATGDTVSNVLGPLAYTFGQYKIEPQLPLNIQPGALERHPTLPEVGTDGFSIATFNAENFFDALSPNPSDPPLPTPKEYQHKALKVANAIAAMGYPTIIAFEEVENVKVLEKVAAQTPLAGYDYQPVLIEGIDSRGIDVGYLVRGDRATVENVELRLDDAGYFTRGPLVMKTTIATDGGDVTLYTIANHFVSMGAGFDATEPRRVKQAEWNVKLVQEILADDPEAHIAILGDLNTFFDTPSIQVFRDAGLVHAFDSLPPKERYTYIFQGESETLDHVLLTPNLAEMMTRVQPLHIDADFPLAAPTDDSPTRTSDHDPVVVWFANAK